MSEETKRVGSGPKCKGAGIDPAAIALVLAGASRERVDAFLKDQQELIAAQLHHLVVNQSHPAPAKFAEAEKYAPNYGGCTRNGVSRCFMPDIQIALGGGAPELQGRFICLTK